MTPEEWTALADELSEAVADGLRERLRDKAATLSVTDNKNTMNRQLQAAAGIQRVKPS
jgi:hypothetical protein